MSDSDHAPLAPSSAHIWAPDDGCRASVAMQTLYPGDEDSEEAREGTAAHWYVSELLNGRDVPAGAVAPNGYPVNAEMVDCAQAILIDVRDTMLANPGGQLFVEQRVFMHRNIHEANDGTPDVRYVLRDQRRAWLWDFKYGHRFVDAVGNWQMVDYGIGTLEAEGCVYDAPPGSAASFDGWRVVITIAQPRNYDPVGPMREWHTTGERLREYVPGMRLAAREAMAPNAPYTTGRHCIDCSASHACPAAQRAGAFAMDISMRGQPVDLPPHAVGLELRLIDDALKRLEARKTGLEEHALGLLRSGTRVPFYTAQHASGREAWTVPAAHVFALGAMYGVDLKKPPEPITPAQARKAGVDAAAMESMAGKPMGALRLKRVDDDAAKMAFQ